MNLIYYDVLKNFFEHFKRFVHNGESSWWCGENMHLWVILLVLGLSVFAFFGWLGKLQNKKKLGLLENKYKQTQNLLITVNEENADQKERYQRLKDQSVKRVKDLRTDVFKMEHKTAIAADVNQQLNVRNEEISKKITQLYNKKQAQISELESEIESLQLQIESPSTSQDQMELLKHTVHRLDDILKEEYEVTDKQLLRMEKRLLQFEPIDLRPSYDNDMKEEQQFYEDDLTEIVGIGPKLAAILREYGISTFRQLAQLNETQISDVSQILGEFGDRIIRDRWIEQARELDKYRQ